MTGGPEQADAPFDVEDQEGNGASAPIPAEPEQVEGEPAGRPSRPAHPSTSVPLDLGPDE